VLWCKRIENKLPYVVGLICNTTVTHLGRKTTPRAPAPLRQMTRTCREEKESARTVRPKILCAKAIRKSAAKPEKASHGKEKHMRFAATQRWKMTFEDPTNKGKS
jgi:hypothetical protein